MFDNIGRKIKTLAQAICWIGIAASCLGGFCVVASANHHYIEEALLIGVAIAAGGSLLSWISCFVLYGFGQLIENTDILVENAKPTKHKKAETKAPHVEPQEQLPKPDNTKKLTQTEYADEFLAQLQTFETADLKLIIESQQDLYTEEEFALITEEYNFRLTGKHGIFSNPFTKS